MPRHLPALGAIALVVFVILLVAIQFLPFSIFHVRGVGFVDRKLVVYLDGKEVVRQLNDGYFSEFADSPDVFFHDSYAQVPWYIVAIITTSFCFLLFIAFLAVSAGYRNGP